MFGHSDKQSHSVSGKANEKTVTTTGTLHDRKDSTKTTKKGKNYVQNKIKKLIFSI